MKQLDLDYKTPFELKVISLDNKLKLCGRMATKNFYCKKGDHEHLLKTSHKMFNCEIKYCSHPECLVQRFSRTVETFKDIKGLHGLRQLWHCAIGFKDIPIKEFRSNFSFYRKKHSVILNRLFSNLKKRGIHLKGLKVMDFSFVTKGQVYVHYHFAFKPVGGRNIGNYLTIIQEERNLIIKRMKKKLPFHFESFNLGSYTGILSYLALRSSGFYKYNMSDNVKYKHIQSNLRESIKKEKYIYFNTCITKDEYIQHFYNRPSFSVVGNEAGCRDCKSRFPVNRVCVEKYLHDSLMMRIKKVYVPRVMFERYCPCCGSQKLYQELPRPSRHGTNITDGIPCECPIHGSLERKDVRIEILFELVPPKKFFAPPELPILVIPERI